MPNIDYISSFFETASEQIYALQFEGWTIIIAMFVIATAVIWIITLTINYFFDLNAAPKAYKQLSICVPDSNEEYIHIGGDWPNIKTDDTIVVKISGGRKIFAVAKKRNKFDGRIGLSDVHISALELDTFRRGPPEFLVRRNQNPLTFCVRQWNHPNNANRVGFQVAVVLSILTVLLSVPISIAIELVFRSHT